MKKPAFVPGASEIGRETLIVLAGALLAALIVGQFPQLKAWLAAQWAPPGTNNTTT